MSVPKMNVASCSERWKTARCNPDCIGIFTAPYVIQPDEQRPGRARFTDKQIGYTILLPRHCGVHGEVGKISPQMLLQQTGSSRRAVEVPMTIES